MRRSIKIFTICIVVSLLLSMYSAVAFADTDSLTIGISVDEKTLTPYTYTSGPGLKIVGLVYDSLFQMDEDLVAQPWLVEEYTVSDDYLTYSFKLHEGVTWHDGTPLTAEDVKFTYEYIMTYPKSRFTKPSKAIISIDVISDYEFTMTLSAPKPTFLLQPLAEMPILPKHIWESIDDPDNSTATVGSGPYVLETVQTGEFYKFTANEDYFMGKPAVKEIIMPIIVDQNTLFTALTTGEIDVASKELSPELLPQFENSDSVDIIKGAGSGTTIMQFNHEVQPFDNKEFRQAISYAVDIQEIIDVVLLGQATQGSMGFLHPSSVYANKEIMSHEFSPEKANEILDTLGYTDSNNDGFREMNGETLAFELLVYSTNAERVRITEFVRDWMKDIGISIKITALDMDTVDGLVWPGFDVTQGRTYDMTMWGWGASSQDIPENMVNLYRSIPDGFLNIGAYSSADFDALADELSTEYDLEARKTIIKDMQTVVAEDVPFLPLYYKDLVYAYNPDAYDGWVFMKGAGIINKLSLIDMSVEGEEVVETEEELAEVEEELTEAPAEPTSETAEEPAETTGNWWVLLIIIAVAVILIIVGRVIANRKKK